MGSNNSYSPIPVIDFSAVSAEKSHGTDNWFRLCDEVRDACENHGCFEAIYNKISPEDQKNTFLAMEKLFELPLEIKKENFNVKPYHGYAGGYDVAALYESFGMEDASNLDSFKSFEELMWPNGNDSFRKNVCPMVKQVEELHRVIGMTIVDSYGLGGEKMEPIMTCKTLVRVMKYKAPPNGEYMSGLNGHTDKLLGALICDTHSGLEIETKDDRWVKLARTQPSSFIFVVGDPLMAWSNGRMHAVRHRVMMEGVKERFSMAVFPVPVAGTTIKPPENLVDDQHPQILKDFDFMDFLDFSFSVTNQGMAVESSKQVFAFAGI